MLVRILYSYLNDEFTAKLRGIKMKYRNLGHTGLKISEIALGSWMTDVSDGNHQKLAAESIRLAYENGKFFDCADAYSGGAAKDS